MKDLRGWIALLIVVGGLVFQMGRLSMQVEDVTMKVAEVQQDLKTFIHDTNERRERGIQQ